MKKYKISADIISKKENQMEIIQLKNRVNGIFKKGLIVQ